MSSSYQPWSPDRPLRGGSGGDDTNATVAVVVAIGCLLVLAGALIAGLTISGIARDDDVWKLRAKIVGLSGFVFGGGGGGGAVAVGAALLVGAVLAAGTAARAGAARLLVGVAAGWLAVVATLSVVVDLTVLDHAENALGAVIGGAVSDLGAVVLAGGALYLALRSR
ncbi:MAG: hypothetical protein QOG43_1347 [Actinomycetota bacterium]|nr:hypothetical protein [Actinomycetota bacterium]